MVAQTLSETEFYQWMNESFARLEFQLQTIFNELRSIRTAREALQTPTPPPTASVVTPPKQVPSTTLLAPKLTIAKPSLTITSKQATSPKLFMRVTTIAPTLKPTLSTGLFKISPPSSLNLIGEISPPFVLRTFQSSLVNKEQIEDGTAKRKWCPPWRLANTFGNTDGRFEWRPPWGILFESTGFHLEDKVNSGGVD